MRTGPKPTAQSEVSGHSDQIAAANHTKYYMHQALKHVRRVLRSATWTKFVVGVRERAALTATVRLDTVGMSAPVSNYTHT